MAQHRLAGRESRHRAGQDVAARQAELVHALDGDDEGVGRVQASLSSAPAVLCACWPMRSATYGTSAPGVFSSSTCTTWTSATASSPRHCRAVRNAHTTNL